VLVCAIAGICYIIAPAISQLVAIIRRKLIIRVLKGPSGQFGSCVECGKDLLTIKPKNPAIDQYVIAAKKTRFFMLQKTGDLEAIKWKNLFLIQSGVTLAYYASPRRKGRGVCLFHEELNETELAARISRIDPPTRLPDPIKNFSIAIGAFLEFCIFLDSLQYDGMTSVSISALVAIFGKALPYCPPGLFFTMAAHLGGNRKGESDGGGQKKSRQRRVVGFLLITAGILLNIAVIFFVIRKVGFGVP
jgi:hypothetical protein